MGVAFCNGGDSRFDVFFEFGVGNGEGGTVQIFNELDGAHLYDFSALRRLNKGLMRICTRDDI